MQLMASGVPTYTEISDIVESLINTEGRRYPIPGMDHDDIAQEIRLECFRVLPFYDMTRIGPSPYKYLQICVKNYLYNMRRGVWVPNNPPCVRCPLWNKLQRRCMIEEVGCEKIVQYRASMSTKADLRSPSSIEEDTSTYKHDHDEVLLDNSIREALDAKLTKYYNRMLEGEKVPSNIKRQIREIVLNIINNA